jgi:hypothetical protein
MSVALLRRSGVFVLLLLLVGFGALAESHEQLASQTGLDPDLVQVLTLHVNGVELDIVLVAITDRTFESRVSGNPTLYNRLVQYKGKNALYVNPTVEGTVSTFPFHPEAFTIRQEGKPAFVPTATDWVSITNGFLKGRFVPSPWQVVASSGSEGILAMGDHIDINEPFTVSYEGQQASFALGSSVKIGAQPGSQSGSSVAASHPPVAVPSVSDVTNLQDTLTHGDFSVERIADLLGLPQDLLGTMTVTDAGKELRLLCIRLEPAVRESNLSADLLSAVDPLIGSGAVMVWALSPTGAPFVPWNFYIQQSGTNYVFFSDASFVELTKGFLHVGRVEPGQIVAGVIRLPSGVKPAIPFSLRYSTTGVTFSPPSS